MNDIERIVKTIGSKPVLGHWPHMQAHTDIEILRAIAAELAAYRAMPSSLPDRIRALEAELERQRFSNHQCAAKDCVNTRDHGYFVGPFCSPCHFALVTGEAKNGTSWIFTEADRVRALEAELEDTMVTLTDLHATILREGILTERRFLDLGMRVVAAITRRPSIASETPASADPNNGLLEPSSVPPAPPVIGNMSGTARINVARVFGKIAAAEKSDSDPKKN